MVDEYITGLTKNIFHTINASTYMGNDAQGAINENVSHATIARVIGPNQEIVDTDYFHEGEFIGLHQASIRYFSEDTTITTGLVLEY